MKRGIVERDRAVRARRGRGIRHPGRGVGGADFRRGRDRQVQPGRSGPAQLPAEGRMLVGYCDDLATPRTLGPFRDLTGSVGTELSLAVTDGSDRDRLLAALRAELDWAGHPAVLVIEDVHWADDATLDVLRYLARRVAALPAVLISTYRDDELHREHPLHGLLGLVSRLDQVRRLPLARLSPAQAGDQNAIAAYGPAAARDAAAAGAHREAAAHFRLVLEHADRFSPQDQAQLLEEYAVETYTVGASDTAVDAMSRAVTLGRTYGTDAQLGARLRWLSRMHWNSGDRAEAERAGEQAMAAAERAGEPGLLALTLSNQSQLFMLKHRTTEAVALGERAVALAREAGDDRTTAHALNNVGAALWFQGSLDGQAMIEEALQVALAARDTEEACRAYVNLVWSLLDWFRLDEADRFLLQAVKLAEEAEFLGLLSYMRTEQARLALARGQWDDAIRYAQLALELIMSMHRPTQMAALTVLARVAARRGQPDAADLLERAWDLVSGSGELQRTGPVAAARAEHAWLRGDDRAARDLARPVYQDACQLGDLVHQAELGYWLSVASEPTPGADEHPYGLLASGRWRKAAAGWESAGCRYERALALTRSPDPRDLLTALAVLDDLGARPLAARVRTRLRALGVTRIPRGPSEETRAHPAGLTVRQNDVLRLLVQGHTNAEIARDLVLSVRTVDSHVPALLAKLGARDRRDAAARATELGLLSSPS